MTIKTFNGKKIVNARKPLAIADEERHVKRGKTNSPEGCAGALACRELPGVQSAHVHVRRVYLEYPDRVVRYQAPQRLRTEEIVFDRGGKFAPGIYTLGRPIMHKREGSKTGDRRTMAER